MVGVLDLDMLPPAADLIRLPSSGYANLVLSTETCVACPGSSAPEGSSAADEKRRRVFDFVRGALAHSSHDVLGPEGMTLAQAVDCPSAAMRAQVLCSPGCWCQSAIAVQAQMTDMSLIGPRDACRCMMLHWDGN